MPNHYNPVIRIHSSAPTRIDLAGGTLDIWPLYLFHERSQTLNAAISLRAECTLTRNPSGRVRISSHDTGQTVEAAHISEIKENRELALIIEIARFFQASGLDISTRSDSPLGAGLAGSSALNIALCGGLARWMNFDSSPDKLIDIAMNIEAMVLKVPTGVQDYRPAMYGGLAAIEMGASGVNRIPISLDTKELEKRLLLVYTGQSRNSGLNNWEITKKRIDGDPQTMKIFDELRDISGAMRGSLLSGDWNNFSEQLNLEWTVRKRLAPNVTTPNLDALVAHSFRAGATAAKVCGAGGGGCLIVFGEPNTLPNVSSALKQVGATILDYKIEPKGLCVTEE